MPRYVNSRVDFWLPPGPRQVDWNRQQRHVPPRNVGADGPAPRSAGDCLGAQPRAPDHDQVPHFKHPWPVRAPSGSEPNQGSSAGALPLRARWPKEALNKGLRVSCQCSCFIVTKGRCLWPNIIIGVLGAWSFIFKITEEEARYSCVCYLRNGQWNISLYLFVVINCYDFASNRLDHGGSGF